MSQPLWNNKEFNKLSRRQTVLHDKVYKFIRDPKKAKRLDKKDGLKRSSNKGWGEWHRKKTAGKKEVKEYMAIKRKLKSKFGY